MFIQQAVQIGTTEIKHSGIDFASMPRAAQYRPPILQNSYYDTTSMSTWSVFDEVSLILKSCNKVASLLH